MSCYFLIGMFFTFIYSAHNERTLSSSGTVFNYDDPKIKYDFIKRILYSEGSKPILFDETLQDAHYVSKNQFIIRSFHPNYTAFKLMRDGQECNVFSTVNNSQLLDNQRYIIDAWGAKQIQNKILIAWIELFIQSNSDQSIKNEPLWQVLEMLEKQDHSYQVSAYLKIVDIAPQPSKNSSLCSQVTVNFPIKNFPLSSRFQRFPYRILFSPDSTSVIIPTSTGFVLKSLVSTYSKIFSFQDDPSDNSSEKEEFFQDFTFKWISNEQFLFIAYTHIVTKFAMYSKCPSDWLSDEKSDYIVDSINQTIEKFNRQQKYLLKLRFGKFNDILVRLWGIFLGVPEEQVILDIPIEK